MSTQDPKRIERVILACVQCRSRHVKCDSNQPVCNRCRRDGKECLYQKSRRGGLDKAALARRRLRLQSEAEQKKEGGSQITIGMGIGEQMTPAQSVSPQTTPDGLQEVDVSANEAGLSNFSVDNLSLREQQPAPSKELSFQINDERLLELYYEYFWPAFPVVLPQQHFQVRRLSPNHGLGDLSLVLEWIGSLYASWCPSEPYYKAALGAMTSPSLLHTPFNVQALMLFAIAQHHQDLRPQSRETLDRAILIALELDMNKREFARAYGEGDPVLEESWRRTWYILSVVDQHFAIVSNSPIYQLANMPNEVDLPCDDEFFEAGQIPTPATWVEFEHREFADVEVVYSSIAYLSDVARAVTFIMNTFVSTGKFGDELIDGCDRKVAIWQSLLPSVKKDPMRKDGSVDEVMYMAHMVAAIVLVTMHRPFSSLSYNMAELSTTAFRAPTPYLIPPASGRNAHTARTLKAAEMHTKLLSIPCTMEKHNVFSMCISAQIATTQISACNNLLEDHALAIARDRVRLSIGYLNTMGSMWALGKAMAKDVRAVARSAISVPSNPVFVELHPTAENEVLRDDLIWPVDPSAQIDIYSGIVMPMDWGTISSSTGSYASSSSSYDVSWSNVEVAKPFDMELSPGGNQ